MADYLSCQDPEKLKKVFLVHGEYETQKTYQGYLKSRGFGNIMIPGTGRQLCYLTISVCPAIGQPGT